MWSVHRKAPSLSWRFQKFKLLFRRFYRRERGITSKFCAKFLDMDHAICDQIFNDFPLLKTTTSANLKQCAAILQRAKYSSDYVRQHLQLLALPPFFLKNCLFMCQEYACYNNEIGPTIIDFNHFLTSRIFLLKERKVIPPHVNVLDSLLFYLKIPKSQCDIEIDDSNTVKEIYWKFYSFFLKKELHTDEETVKKIRREDYFASFRLISENLYLLKNSFGFSNEQILQMPFLLRTNSENTVAILRSARGVNLKEVIVTHPRLLTVPSENIIIVNQFMRDNDIDFNLLLNDPEILRIDINLLMYRLTKLACTPSLSIFKNHPKICDLLRFSSTVSERVHILKRLSMNCINVNLLTCSRESFLKHIVDGIDKNNICDVCIIVSQKLNKQFNDVKRELSKNKAVQYVPLSTICNNLDYLLHLGFSNDNIYRNIQILLYPTNLIESKLDEIMINSVEVKDWTVTQLLKSEYYLSFALYFIERDYNFTEAGIWCETTPKIPDGDIPNTKFFETS